MQALLVLLTSLVPVSSWFLPQPQTLLGILKNHSYFSPVGSGGTYHDNNKLGAVTSENKVCSQIGIDLLRVGGNAADALIGTVFCIGVVDCHHSGPGGGGFALARSSNGTYESVDFREAAPGAASENMYKDNVVGSILGGLASGVPGEVRGLKYIHDRYGSLPWTRLLQPAIELARDGFVVSNDFAMAMDLSTRKYDFLTREPSWAEDFAPHGIRVKKGEVMTRKRYATTLQAIATEGADAFYTGAIGKATIDAIRANDGLMVLRDLEEYRVLSRRPLKIRYGDFIVYGGSVPASSAVVLSALKILEGYGKDGKHLSIHRMDEAMRFGFGKRASFGDPDFTKGLSNLEREMLSEEFAAKTRSRISDDHTLNVSDYNPDGFEILNDHGTSHVVTADASGMAFSLTTTINLFFGSRLMVNETGLILNNEMNDFSISNVSNAFGYYPSPSNFIRPAKRPLTSISPLITEHKNGTLYCVFGASGGSRIISTTLQNALHILDSGMSITEAVKQPRLHDQLIPNVAVFEEGYEPDTMEFMKGRGHNVTLAPTAGSSAQALRIVNGNFEAAGEPRQKDSAGLTA